MRRKRLYQIIILFLLCLTFIPGHAGASDTQSIRVGLKSLYKDKASIILKNTKVEIGYSLDNTFTGEATLESSTGFKFTPATGYYYKLDKNYKLYQDAKKVATTLKELGVDAYPVVSHQKTWSVYVGGSATKSTVEAQYRKAKGRFGFTYSSIFADNDYRIKVVGEQDTFLIDVNNKKAYPQISAKSKNSSGVTVLDLGTRQYRGRIEIGRYQSNQLTAVNIVPIEEYLYGVVPCEMVSSWPLEVLKVQAVCARSYAIRNAGYRCSSNANHAYTMDDTTSSQVYKGYLAEIYGTTRAVKETSGETVCYNNQIIAPYYYSTSGGKTENVEDVWSMTKPYLRSVPDLFELEPERQPWIVRLTKSEIVSKLSAKGIKIGTFKNIFPEIITGSGRVYSLKIQGTTSSTTLQSDTIRSILSLDSTKFKVIQYADNPDKVVMRGVNGTKTEKISNCYTIDGNYRVQKASSSLDQYVVISEDNLTNFPRIAPQKKDTIYFAGQGYGHGIGMSQSGAKGMAKAGFTYKEILEYYYVGAVVR